MLGIFYYNFFMFLSVALAVYNEEEFIRLPIESTIDWVDEIVIVDGGSTDRTVEIAKSYGKKVRVIHSPNPEMFHINKQKALDACRGEWILQLDADEKVSKELASEIQKVLKMSPKELEDYQKRLPDRKLFLRHQKLIEERIKAQGGRVYKNGPIVAFFIPRLNYFLGKFLRYGGLYPDGSIRLVKKGEAFFPCRDVHEVMEVKGRVGWLQNPLLHYDSPTFERYIKRNNRYVLHLAREMAEKGEGGGVKGFFEYVIFKPLEWFVKTFFLYEGFLDGWRGFLFSFFSSIRFARAYFRKLKAQNAKVKTEKIKNF